MAALEAAEDAIAFASGMGAITTLALTLSSGDRVVIPDDVYGGTYRLFAKVFNQMGIAFTTVDMTDVAAVSAVIDDDVAMVIAETPTNPTLKILDLAALGEAAHSVGAKFVVDNTFATQYIQRPLSFGADAVVYSATKYLGGHSDLVMGSVATNDLALAEKLRFLQNAAGAVPGPFDCWLLLRGLKTLSIRMRAHCAGAAVIASWLRDQMGDKSAVRAVYYPGFEDSLGHKIATIQMSAAGHPLYGGMVSFETDTEERALKVCQNTKLFFLGESLGGVESLIEHPGKMTHASLEGSDLAVSQTLIRLSVGIEHPDDLVVDLRNAFA